jgi:3-isopropylmalate dehydrogenase
VLSVAMLLDHLGLTDEAARVEAAVAADLAERGTRVRSTAEVGADLVARL